MVQIGIFMNAFLREQCKQKDTDILWKHGDKHISCARFINID